MMREPSSMQGTLDAATQHALLAGRHADPFSVLGPHQAGAHTVVRVLAPDARTVMVELTGGQRTPLLPMQPGLFEHTVPGLRPGAPAAYRLCIEWERGVQHTADPYAFGPVLDATQLEHCAAGGWRYLSDLLGAHAATVDGCTGTRFALWAPNARRVAVVGDFNGWDGRRHAMRLRYPAGVWELFLPDVGPGARYKFQVLGADGHTVLKADPLARQAEAPPATASIVPDERPFAWTDGAWMEQRAARQRCDAPISIYEVHAGSWFDEAGAPRWQSLAARLPEYARSLGFTHIELLPVMAHPFGGSWGYQPLGLFAPAAGHGAPADFAHFVDRCHEAGLGVILDWVPAHFPDDAHGLARLDGTPLYEHADPREGRHPDWNTLIYNYGRREVRAFLIASAIHWLRHYHVDGLRVDAVASMLYRDYSRPAGQWIPNRHGGRENLEAIEFLRELNAAVGAQCPGAITVAEESTAWPGVTAPVANGGLGFDYKWNLGWMHDTLRYMRRDPIHRRHHHHDLSFGMVYAYAERFVLPLSHDEVVHGKGSLLGKMPGERAAQLAQLRLYYAFMWAHPGKKLLFMGGEFGQLDEWNHDAMLQWRLLDDPAHRGLQRLVADLNHVYATLPELHCRDADPSGFAWIVGDDADNSVLAFARVDASHCLVAVCNFTPVARPGYRFGVPHAGDWRVRVDTGARRYGGAGGGPPICLRSEPIPAHGHPQSLVLDLPGFTALYLRHSE